MEYTISAWLVLATLSGVTRQVSSRSYMPNPDFGYPAGLIPECPGVLKNASISPRKLNELQITIHRVTKSGQIYRKTVPVEAAPKFIAKDKHIDLINKKTVVYLVGYLDSSVFPHDQALATAYSKRGYNVFVSDTAAIFSYIYPKSVRLTKVVGIKIGELVVKLTNLGLDPSNLELIGLSLGAHVAGYAAKYFYQATGRKPSRLTGLDPAGPCYRNLDSKHKIWHTDAEKVDIIHTNIDGFGMAERLGHVDIYVNGGEFQPGDIPFVPCLMICSHLKVILYWWQALENPKKFIAVQCETVQDARFAQCFNGSVTNYLGLETKFDKPGIYYLATGNEFPYFMGKDGLKEENEIYTSVSKEINDNDDFVLQ